MEHDITINYFGMLTDKTGKSTETINLNSSFTVDQLNQFLIQKYTPLANCNYQIAIDNTLIKDKSIVIKNKSEISLLPPFSGG